MLDQAAADVVRRCRAIAALSEEPGATTRPFLCESMRRVHDELSAWMRRLGMHVRVDAAGNLRGVRPGASPDAAPLYLGSHLDTVPNAGAFDGVLGVVMAIALVEIVGARRLPYAIEVVGFSEEEGVRFGVPFIGSRAIVGDVDAALLDRRDAEGVSVAEAIRRFGLDPAAMGDANVAARALGYVEFHIEQGPVLDDLNLPLAVVEAIAGQTRAEVAFVGVSGHAGTTPMAVRRDAVAGAAEWIGMVEEEARRTPDLVATVGRVGAQPGASNVVAGRCLATLDVRHAGDRVRTAAVTRLQKIAHEIAERRGLKVDWAVRLDQPATPMASALVERLARAVDRAGVPSKRLTSGAGHDAMVVARAMPAAMLFLRSPGGVSHDPAETVRESDVALGLKVGLEFLEELQ